MRSIASTLFLSACLFAGFTSAAKPTKPAKPALTYLYSATFSGSAPIDFGQTPLGDLTFTPITGGNFTGPRLNGIYAPQTSLFVRHPLTHNRHHRFRRRRLESARRPGELSSRRARDLQDIRRSLHPTLPDRKRAAARRGGVRAPVFCDREPGILLD